MRIRSIIRSNSSNSKGKVGTSRRLDGFFCSVVPSISEQTSVLQIAKVPRRNEKYPNKEELRLSMGGLWYIVGLYIAAVALHGFTAVALEQDAGGAGMRSPAGGEEAPGSPYAGVAAVAAAKAFASSKTRGAMLVRAYLQLPDLKKAPPEVCVCDDVFCAGG